jgi:hypothetical protein
MLRLLLTVALIGTPISCRAATATWTDVNVSLDVTIDKLNTMRIFAKACSLSTGEQITREFIDNYSVKAGVARADIEKLVGDKLAVDPGAQGPRRKCQLEEVKFWLNAFRQDEALLNEVLAEFLKRK